MRAAQLSAARQLIRVAEQQNRALLARRVIASDRTSVRMSDRHTPRRRRDSLTARVEG